MFECNVARLEQKNYLLNSYKMQKMISMMLRKKFVSYFLIIDDVTGYSYH